MLYQVKLRNPGESLQIPYPSDWEGDKSGDETDTSFHLSPNPRFLTQPEIELGKEYVSKLGYSQAVVLTGAKLIGDDLLISKTHDELDAIEVEQRMPNTRRVNGGERSVYERVLIIRERGYEEND